MWWWARRAPVFMLERGAPTGDKIQQVLPGL